MVKDPRLYNALNIPPTASQSDIKKAYRVQALRYHPDKNNESEESKKKFQDISEAYSILRDENQRKMYDKYGTVNPTEIQQQNQRTNVPFTDPFGMSAADLFSQFFDTQNHNSGQSNSSPPFGFPFNSSRNGNGNNNRAADGVFGDFFNTKSRPLQKGPDINHNLKCTIKDLYRGKRSKLRLERSKLCSICKGDGGVKRSMCNQCHGDGNITETTRLGPMLQTFTHTCNICNGNGWVIISQETCQGCNGVGFYNEMKIFDVEIYPGMKDGTQIVFNNEGDEIVNKRRVIPGNVIIHINEIEDNKFKRVNDGQDLYYWNYEIDLFTSLCGGVIYIKGHPNNKLIKVDILPGEIIESGSVKGVESLGMPKNKGNEYGILYIQFQVKYPEKLNMESIKAIEKILLKDENVKQMQKNDENIGLDDDCIEVEEYVLSSFVPPVARTNEKKRARN
ncbi:hypothetical protein TBLA_0E03660 [Henningerozyma blattae CBS 6284]|uniref:J domain-containing protein n=1 Tax=Henningerozyma blattae (strain ATCC 34711 / CBS 6284 / DSM 70876 / NBRC 10599 / NRRL Y-10934 / UCD 77-7) TaxID=1071380 RepID=I2H4W8_HENB6|nr:hypothetical protein TBLA_0E03660 [Tetrapisispora blattae CBS 6284]CCH61420.1 hypothetical protein TBLA_0E03660 [Tetrapisispora blattae CBS 6284]